MLREYYGHESQVSTSTNLSKYLNPNFSSYDSLVAENFFILKKYEKSKKIYKKLSNTGTVYKWHADRQIAFILDNQNKEKEAISFLTESYESIKPDIYQTFDFANFLRDREKYEKSIDLYSKILSKINSDHQLYQKVLDRRGTARERINRWNLAEKDILTSVRHSPKSIHPVQVASRLPSSSAPLLQAEVRPVAYAHRTLYR